MISVQTSRTTKHLKSAGLIFGTAIIFCMLFFQQVNSQSIEDSVTEENLRSAPAEPAHRRMHPPPPEYFDEEHREPRYVQIISTPTSVLKYLSPHAPILGMVKKGDVLLLVGEGDAWCKVVYGDTTGWVEKRHTRVVSAPSSLILEDAKTFFLWIVIGAILISVLVMFITIRHIKAERRRGVYVQKNALIIARENKMVNYTLTNKAEPLDKCFSEIGFNVNVARDLNLARNSINHSLPDLVLVDWKFASGMLSSIEKVFSQRSSTSNAVFIFYNIPDPTSMASTSVLPNVRFLGITFSDRDLFKLVTPLIITSEQTKKIRKSVQSSALEGEIEHGNLLEVLQFIEIGSKTGCLLIESGSPFGLVYFRNGRIVYAATSKAQGKMAVFSILNLKYGKFRFVINKQPNNPNINLSTLEILMEWTKELDEAHEAHGH